MTRLRFLILLGLAAIPPGLMAQRDSTYYQDAKAPSTEALDRLHLTTNWSTFVPLADRFDHVGLVQINGGQLFVQVTSGKLFVLNAATGEIQWKYVYPTTNQQIFPLAFIPERVFAVNGLKLFSFDRQTGKTILEQNLPSSPATGPSADLTSVYVPLAKNDLIGYSHSILIFPGKAPPPPETAPIPKGISLMVPQYETLDTTTNKSPSVAMLSTLKSPFQLPGIDAIISVAMLQSVSPPYKIDLARSPSIALGFPLTQLTELSSLYVRDIMPTKLFSTQLGYGVASPPIVTKDNLLVPTLEQTVVAIDKVTGKTLFEFRPTARISSPITVIGRTAFVTTGDSTLFQIDTERLARLWRFTGGARLSRKPFVTDDTVFAGGPDAGIFMIDRETGDRIWFHPTADQILAMNPKYIYATDKLGKLHVLDRRRGISLSNLDMKQFSLGIPNEQDDRLYFAGRNGLLLSLRDKDYRNPVPVISPPKVEPKDAAEAKVEEPKVEEPKKEEMKKEEPKKLEPKKEEPKKEKE